jgi:succinate dehydrogenase (ubiquinone) cytochrome b560 subunit
MYMSELGSQQVCGCCYVCFQLINKRPLSPDVFELNSMQPHYKMPWGAMSSIMNRATGAALSAGAVWVPGSSWGWLGPELTETLVCGLG